MQVERLQTPLLLQFQLLGKIDNQKKLRMQLAVLDTAQIIEYRDVPVYCLHALKEKKQNLWSITVNANWQLTLEFKEGNVHILN